VTGRDAYQDAHSFYTEQLGNPSLSSPHVLTARGVIRLLRGEVSNARSDLEQSLQDQGGNGDAETVAALAVAAGLGAKPAEADEWWT
jgi:coatomer subunit epsilon